MKIDKQSLRRMIFKEIKLLKEEKSAEASAKRIVEKLKNISKIFENDNVINIEELKKEDPGDLMDFLNQLEGNF